MNLLCKFIIKNLFSLIKLSFIKAAYRRLRFVAR
nr:MAG TPA: hypothetical protein [Caudoviricetes sp.]DAW42092.1 MAG TPA: hypothetical protein [Caudoviricetes sp.]